jgi:hypothetical protein
MVLMLQVSHVSLAQPNRLVVSVGANPTSSWWSGEWMEALKGQPWWRGDNCMLAESYFQARQAEVTNSAEV